MEVRLINCQADPVTNAFRQRVHEGLLQEVPFGKTVWSPMPFGNESTRDRGGGSPSGLGDRRVTNAFRQRVHEGLTQ